MILCGRQWECMSTVSKDKKTGLHSGHKFFNHKLGASFPECAIKYIIDGGTRLSISLSNDNAFACRQPIRFDNDRGGVGIKIGMGICG